MQVLPLFSFPFVFTGIPLGRDPDWIDLNIRYTIDVIKGSIIVALFPKLLKP